MASSKNEAKIKFSADTSDFNDAIKRAGSEMTQLRSELKLNEAQMQNTGQTVDGLAKSKAILEQQEQALSAKVEALNGKYEAAVRIWGENSIEAHKYATQLNGAMTAQERIRGQIDQTSQSIESQAQAQNRSVSEYDKLNSTISEHKTRVSSLEREYANAVLTYGKNSSEVKELETRLSRASAELHSSEIKMEAANDSARELSQGFDEASDSAGDMKNSISELAAGTLIGDFAHEALSTLVDDLGEIVVSSDGAASKLKATFGSHGAEQFGELNDALHNIYAGNYGDDFEDIADAASEVVKVLGNDISSASLEEITTQALILRDTFGTDVNESVKAASQLMDSFGMDGKDAFDLLALGVQSGLDMNGEWFDSVSEYSNYYSQLGLSADDMFNNMSAGSHEFLMGVDKAGDAMKELSIRSIDMSTTSQQGYDALGLSMDDYAARIAAGGDSARGATMEIIDALLACDDPVQQNIAGVALFGTQWEDLGADGMNAMLGLMGSAVDASGTMEGIDSIRYDNVGDQAETLKRKFEEEIIGPVVDEIQPALNGFFAFVNDNFSWLGPIIVGVGVAFGILAAAMAITSIIQGVAGAFAALNIVMGLNPIVLIVAAVVGLVAAFVLLWNNCEEFRNFWIGLWDAICAKAGEIWGWLDTNLVQPIQAGFQGFCDFMNLLFTDPFSLLRMAGEGIAGWFNENFPGVSDTVGGVINGMQSFFADPFGTLLNKGVEIVNWADSQFPGFKSAVGGALDEMQSFFADPFGYLRSKVEDIINWVQSHFRLPEIEFPHINLPHFTIQGSFSLNPPSIPTLGVSWYAKGAVLNKPTIFGRMGNTFMGGGDAGPEAVSPVSVLQGYIVDAVSSARDNGTDRIVSAIGALADRVTVLEVNGKVFATAVASDSDRVNGSRQNFAERGLAL